MMLSMMIAVFASRGHKFPQNRSALYEQAVEAVMKSAHQVLKGIAEAGTGTGTGVGAGAGVGQAELTALLRKLSLRSQRRRGQFRIFGERDVEDWLWRRLALQKTREHVRDTGVRHIPTALGAPMGSQGLTMGLCMDYWMPI